VNKFSIKCKSLKKKKSLSSKISREISGRHVPQFLMGLDATAYNALGQKQHYLELEQYIKIF